MSKLNLTPETLRQLYPPMPEETKLKLQHRMRQLMLEAPKTKPVRRISRGLAIAIAITALLLGTALAEVTTGVVSRTIQQVVRLVTSPSQAPALSKVMDVDVVRVKLWGIQADSRAIYLNALARMKDGSGLVFQQASVPYDDPIPPRPADDRFPAGEKAGPVVRRDSLNERWPFVELSLDPVPKSREDLLHEVSEGWEPPGFAYARHFWLETKVFGPGYELYPHLNSDGSLHNELIRMHRGRGGTVQADVHVEAGLLQFDMQRLNEDKLVQSDKKTIRISIPVQKDRKRADEVKLGMDVMRDSFHLERLVITYTPLNTYADLYWRPNGPIEPDEMLLFYIELPQDEDLPHMAQASLVMDYKMRTDTGFVTTSPLGKGDLPDQLLLKVMPVVAGQNYLYTTIPISLKHGVVAK